MGERRFTDPMRWRQDLILVAALLIGFVVIGWLAVGRNVGDDSEDIRDLAESTRAAAIQNCNDLVTVEYKLIDALREGIKDDRALPASFFPSIPRAKFRQLIREGIRQDHQAIRDLRPPATCSERFNGADTDADK